MKRVRTQDGYAMAALLVALSVMSVVLGAALPVWHTAAKREREAELVFRGEQYARAVALFQRKYAGAFPPNMDVLLDQRFLRKKYKDPMTEDGEFQVMYAGQGVGQPIQGQGSQRPGVAGAPSDQPGRTPGAALPPTGQRPRSGASAGQGQGFGAAQPRPMITGSQAASGFGTSVAGPQAGVMGVVSKSTATALRLYNGRDRYNQWAFVATAATTQAGAPAGAQTQTPGQPPRRGIQPGQPGRGPAAPPAPRPNAPNRVPSPPGMPGSQQRPPF